MSLEIESRIAGLLPGLSEELRELIVESACEAEQELRPILDRLGEELSCGTSALNQPADGSAWLGDCSI